jgi:2-polyprenyl-6-hydroxyphenyl methylase/3-demethylubiquinone-9 3-methyltransferase
MISPTIEKKTNADASELAKFSDSAHRWWDMQGEFGPLHEINPIRLEWINSHVALSGMEVLDIGCGGGILSESMAKSGASQVCGIDLSEKALKVAKLHCLEHQVDCLNYLETSAEDLATLRPASFDVVTCMEMLEHVPEPSSVIRACSDLVRPGGWVFVSTINRNLRSFLMAIVGAEYLLKMIPKGTHEYLKLIRPSELISFAHAAGLSAVQIKGLHYNPITRRYWLSNEAMVNYFVAFRKQA